jgi:pimeloyl-ACP methyl ester carboxylesterase
MSQLTSSVARCVSRARIAFFPSLSRQIFQIVSALLILWVCPASAQLSQNSGINASDTYAIFDISFQGQATSNLDQAIYNPTTNSTSSVLNLTPNVRHFHVEIGYDASDQLVLNIYSTDPTTDPTQSPYGDISKIQVRDGKLTVFDESGNPYPISLPNNAPLPMPLTFLGSIPGSSVLNYLVLSNPSSTASAMNASVQYSGWTTTNSNTIQSYAIPAGSRVQMAYISKSYSSDISGTTTMAYEQFTGGWALAQASQSISFSNTQGNLSAQFANLQWYDNSSGDSRRASKANTSPPAPLLSPANDPVPPLPAAATNTPNLDIINLGGGPTNLLYQHGIFSSEDTWKRLDCPASTPLCTTSWLRSDFGFNTIAKSNLKSTDYLTSQANSLITLLQGSGTSGFLAIGHSNGAPIIRDVAFRQPSLVNRVISVDGDNNGAEMTQVSKAALAGAVTDLARILKSVGSGTPLSGAAFTLGNALIATVPQLAVAAFDANIAATSDMQPGSSYFSTLNSRNETFTRVGIQGASRWRFVEWRLAGDALCNPETACGGRAFYNYANGVYFGLRACEIIAWLFGDYNLAIRCDFFAFTMDYIDLFWYVYTSFGDSSDGIIQGGGQAYRNATANYVIRNADSHLGATKSDKVRSQLDYTLQHDFLLTPKWCMTGTLSPSSLSPSYLGGTQSFSVNVTSGCPWTAVSSVPWIAINSSASGTASASVTISSDVNLSPVARTGTITITGLQSNLSVSVTQSGLSPAAATGSVVIAGSEQTSGGSLTPGTGWVTVSGTERWLNEPGCPGSSQRWDGGIISITANGAVIASVNYGDSSTGCGTPSPMPTSSSIASQLASAINGNGSSPVTATVNGATISLTSKAAGANTNYPLSTQVMSYFVLAGFPPASFSMTTSGATLTGGNGTYDTGSVWVTVNGVQTSVSYGQSSTPFSIAAGLVAVINGNSGSYVRAGVIGSTVWLVSIATQGANYPLSSGVTYDSSHFPQPSFSTKNSGATLTGSP